MSIFKFSKVSFTTDKLVSFYTTMGGNGTVLTVQCKDYASVENLRFNAVLLISQEQYITADDIENIIVKHNVRIEDSF